ncbi:MAG: 16S rRNA (guanine(527)-N(7))-methyltransferase RsmG [Peptococcaceae bacterium]|nr:16S rRNA (guanine(527)-N(7))-methyltransferase RsmG [Peptococcaceae bacterium]
MGIKLDGKQMAAFSRYYKILVEENEKYNLTAITGEREAAAKHFLDSLSCAGVIRLSGRYVVDVGTGAGFPGIPLKIYRPDMDLLLVEAVKKKVDFLTGLLKRLGIERAEARWDRAENMGRAGEFREKADIVVSRAVAPLNVLAELCLPLVRVEGWFLSMKGPDAGGELDASRKAIGLLGGELERMDRFKLPLVNEERTILLFKKTGPTPEKYPRRAGMPAKRPIV